MREIDQVLRRTVGWRYDRAVQGAVSAMSRCGACVFVIALGCGAPAGESESISTEGSETGEEGGSEGDTGGQLPDPEPDWCARVPSSP